MAFDILAGFVILLSIVMIILSGIILGSAGKISDNTQKKDIKNSSIGLLVISVLLFIIGLFMVFLHRTGYSASANRAFFF